MKIAVVGATGAVGENMVKILEELKIKIEKIDLYSSLRSKGKKIKFKEKEIIVKELNQESFNEEYDYVLFSAGASVSKKYAPIAAKHGSVVIDNSSAFRMQKKIPLVVPEINKHLLKKYKGIISNPNCSTIQMVLALNQIQKNIGIKTIVVSTYQAVSGAGNLAIKELIEQSENIKNDKKIFSKQIDKNLIPIIGETLENDFTTEEEKLIKETNKIFNSKIHIIPTAIRVPVIYGHSESVYIKTKKDTNKEEIKEYILKSEHVKIYENDLLTPKDVENSNITYVSRIRQIKEKEYALWIVADNLRVGAATNAIRIMLEHMKINGVDHEENI
jgi:aspartate-semialdehyde dehydrogenase